MKADWNKIDPSPEHDETSQGSWDGLIATGLFFGSLGIALAFLAGGKTAFEILKGILN